MPIRASESLHKQAIICKLGDLVQSTEFRVFEQVSVTIVGFNHCILELLNSTARLVTRSEFSGSGRSSVSC